jgi:hypothetical protein
MKCGVLMASEKFVENMMAEYEELIRQIKDVISARIVTDKEAGIAEIHVLAGSGRGPKQVVRDIESALMAQFGISIDHKKISVAQMREDDMRPVNEFRPSVTSVSVVSKGRAMEARVQLSIGEETFEGTASGPSTANNKLRLISQATALALEGYLSGSCNIVTEDISTIVLSRRPAIAVCMALVTNFGEERLIGAAFTNEDDREAAVKATLAAVNRRIPFLLNE